MKPFILGVTGCVGAGKSTISRWLRAKGWALLDVDDLARECVQRQRSEISSWVPQAVDSRGNISIPVLMQMLFGDELVKSAVEKLLLPHIKCGIEQWRQRIVTQLVSPTVSSAHVGDSSFAGGRGVLDSALLFEFGLDDVCDATLAVTCSAEIRKLRVQERAAHRVEYKVSGANEERQMVVPSASTGLFGEIEQAQYREAMKVQRCDYSLSTEGTIEETQGLLEAMLKLLQVD